jgi:Xaa-Pro dipeptidase
VAPTPEALAPGPDDRFAALAGFCDGITPVSDAELEQRRERMRALAEEQGYDAVLVEAGVNLGYFTGVRWGQSERPLLMVLPVKGEPVWVGPQFEHGKLSEQIGDLGELHGWHEHESPYARVAEALAARGIRRGRIGVDPDVRLFVFDGLRRAATKARFDAAPHVFAGARMIKSGLELRRLRRANEATKAALALAAQHVEPGMTEAEISTLVRDAQTVAGLSQIWVLALTGPNAAFPHGTRNGRPLESGDLILVDTGGALHGYRSDITRTWAVGTPSNEQRRAWDTVLAAQNAALDAIRPGGACAEVDAAARGVIEAAGYGADYDKFTHRLGHGIGLQVHEEPYLVRGNQLALAPGMTFSNEPGIYVPGSLGVRLEDIVAVTAEGPEVFGPRPTSLDDPFGEA